jgi:indole-3-glycerol phosphate synthase
MMMTTTSTGLLAAIMAASARSAAERERRDGPAVQAASDARSPRGAEFKARLSRPGVNVIAECKRRSPSRGILRHPYDPAAIAAAYAGAGAAAISVLTEAAFFDGALEHLSAVRDRVDVPVLRKDFVSLPFQLVEARAAGADAVLLIVAGLDTETLAALVAESARLGLAALVEVHSRRELLQALGAGADLVGVNSRNLKTLAVDLHVHDEIIHGIPAGVTPVAESGLTSAEDVIRLRASGYDAFLIGERFMTAGDPGAALGALIAATERSA